MRFNELRLIAAIDEVEEEDEEEEDGDDEDEEDDDDDDAVARAAADACTKDAVDACFAMVRRWNSRAASIPKTAHATFTF